MDTTFFIKNNYIIKIITILLNYLLNKTVNEYYIIHINKRKIYLFN